jgi:hypothetical protein
MSESHDKPETERRHPRNMHDGQIRPSQPQRMDAISHSRQHISRESQRKHGTVRHSSHHEVLESAYHGGYQAQQEAQVKRYSHQEVIAARALQGGGDGLTDYLARMEDEYGFLERERGKRPRRRPVDEGCEVEESPVDRVESGCLGGLGTEIKRLFRCGSRKQGHGTEMQAYKQNPHQTGNEERRSSTLADGNRTVTPSLRCTRPPQNSVRDGPSNTRTPAAPRIGARPYEGQLPSTGIGQESSELQAHNPTVAPALLPAAESAHISGGQFNVANNIVQHIYPAGLPIVPPLGSPGSGGESTSGSRTVRYEVTWREVR